ncbi:hypothetical protein [Streptomyces sp. S3(2020)]|nr:hypothetical protein [Streptomyces sp. S3(2020)]
MRVSMSAQVGFTLGDIGNENLQAASHSPDDAGDFVKWVAR